MGGVKTISGALGVLMMLLGLVWVLQGLNISFAPQSFMTADINWTYRGAAFALVGLVLLIWALRAGRWKDILGALGALVATTGFLWLLQAVSLNSGAANFHSEWALRGAIALAIGAVLIFVGSRGNSAA